MPEAGVRSEAHRWLLEVLAARGWRCGNCNQWRVLKGRDIEKCPSCHDDVFDVYDFVEEYEAGNLP